MALTEKEHVAMLRAQQMGIISIHEYGLAEEIIQTRGLETFLGFCKARADMQEQEAETTISRLLGTPPVGH